MICIYTNTLNARFLLLAGTDSDSTFQNRLKSNGASTHPQFSRTPNSKQYRHGSLNRTPDFFTTENEGVQCELRCILKEIRVITDKIRAEVYFNQITMCAIKT